MKKYNRIMFEIDRWISFRLIDISKFLTHIAYTISKKYDDNSVMDQVEDEDEDDWLPMIVDISDEEIKWLSSMVYHESKYCSDRHQQLVAMTAINRMRAAGCPEFDYISWYDVLSDSGGYHDWYRSDYAYKYAIHEDALEYDRCKRNVQMALRGFCECPINMIFASKFEQGTYVYEVKDNDHSDSTIYFCLENIDLFPGVKHW